MEVEEAKVSSGNVGLSACHTATEPKRKKWLAQSFFSRCPYPVRQIARSFNFFNTNEESIEFYLSIFCWQSFTGFERVTVKNSEELQVLKLVLNFKDFSYKGISISPMPILESTSGITAAVLMLLGFLKCEKFLEKFSGGAVKPSNPEDSCCMMSYDAAVRTPA